MGSSIKIMIIATEWPLAKYWGGQYTTWRIETKLRKPNKNNNKNKYTSKKQTSFCPTVLLLFMTTMLKFRKVSTWSNLNCEIFLREGMTKNGYTQRESSYSYKCGRKKLHKVTLSKERLKLYQMADLYTCYSNFIKSKISKYSLGILLDWPIQLSINFIDILKLCQT